MPKEDEECERITQWMCSNFYDIRTFVAVMTNEVNAGQVRGPVQINIARSIEPIFPIEVTMTRMAVTNERDLEKERTFGRKHIVPYALYRAEGYVSAKLAINRTGFSDDDLDLLWEAMQNMFEHDHSAARGKMNTRGLYIFKHESSLGNAPAHKLFALISVTRTGLQGKPARGFSDYTISINRDALPAGVTMEERL